MTLMMLAASRERPKLVTMVCDVAVVEDECPDVDRNRAVAVFASNSFVVFRVLPECVPEFHNMTGTAQLSTTYHYILMVCAKIMSKLRAVGSLDGMSESSITS